MFESDNSAAIYAGGMIRNFRIAQENAQAADDWQAAYERRGGALQDWMNAHARQVTRIAELEGAQAGWQAKCDRLRVTVNGQQGRIRQLELEVQKLRRDLDSSRSEAQRATAQFSGCLAVIRAYEQAHPDSPLRNAVNHDWDGQPYSQVQAAFDAAYAAANGPVTAPAAIGKATEGGNHFIGQED